MSVRVVLSIGEEYPHLFISADADEVRAGERSGYDTIVELTDEEWAEFRQAEDRYYRWVERLDRMREAAARE